MMDFFLPFYFLLQISVFLIIVAIVGGNNVGSAFVKPWDEYMY